MSPSKFRSAWLEPDDPRWTAALHATPHDVYHLPEYVELDSRAHSGKPVAFWAEGEGDQILIPLVLRDVAISAGQPPVRDAISPYGYGSPLWWGRRRAEVLAKLLAEFQHALAVSKIVSVFLRLHPLLPLDTEILTAAGNLVVQGRTVVVDTARPYGDLFQSFRSNHRRNLCKLERDGYVATLDDWDSYDSFIAIYDQTMRRRNASESYFFDSSYFRQLRSSLGDKLKISTVHGPDGSVASAGVFLATGSIVQYHLGGTAEKHQRAAPSKLMMANAIRWASEKGFSQLHMGGGLGGGEDSLFLFKAGFSEQTRDFCSLRVIGCEGEYARLSEASGWRSPEDNSPSGYFPLYRRPRAA